MHIFIAKYTHKRLCEVCLVNGRWEAWITMEEKKGILSVNNIQDKVYVIRGQQVVLDFDLAEIYGYEVKKLNQQVKRNIDRFPEDFMFQLSRNETLYKTK